MQRVHHRPTLSIRLLLTLLPLLSSVPSTLAATLRVDPNATGEPVDGLSWTNAFRTITNALSVSAAGDEIWVAAGTYSGGIVMKPGVALYGGFDGSEATRGERRPAAHVSTIDGRGTTNGISFGASGLPTTRVDGFTLRNCVAAIGSAFRVRSSSPTLAGNWIVNCEATAFGAGVYLEASAAVITNNVFLYNGSDGLAAGGAIFATNSGPRLVNNTFSGNRAREGGGVAFALSSGFVERNQFIANRAIRDGGGFICLNSSPRTAYNRFAGNVGGSRGGALAIGGGGSSPLVFNNVMVRNSAANDTNSDPRGGGGIFIDLFSLPSIVNNTLVSNSAPVGGIVCLNPGVALANNIVAFGSSGIGGAATLQLFNNNVFGNNGRDYVDTADPTGTGGNVSEDPKFAGDTGLGVVNFLPDSVNRDGGIAALLPPGTQVDIDGSPRVQGESVDIGAVESDGETTYFLPPIVRVSPTGDDEAAGDSWATPMRTLQAAADRAGRTGGELWVKSGTYSRVEVRPFTYLYGGFAGTETNRNARNWRTNVTVLDGGFERRVVTMTRLSLGEVLDGFVIQNGRANAGGGLFTDSNVRITHNRFASNAAAIPSSTLWGGGAVYVAGGSPLILNNHFFRNTATSSNQNRPGEGGAIKVNDGTPIIANNEFRQNVATNDVPSGETRGGAICAVVRGAPQIINNTILQNWATAAGGTAGTDLGALFVGNTNQPARIGNNLIAYNSSGVATTAAQPPEILNNLVFANIRANFGGISNPIGTNGNISASPRLTGPYGDVHLTEASPCVDGGDTNLIQPDWTDVDGVPRISGTAVDIGADEFDGAIYEIADRIFYVSPNGDDTNDGRSWTNARSSLDVVLADAGLSGGEVWVMAGTYTNRFRANVFTYLYGGFDGTETNRVERNWAANVTVLDGGVSANAPTQDPGPAVVSIFGLDKYAALSGFTIQNGAGRQGGGVFAHGSPLISDNIIQSNTVASVSGFLACGAGIFSQGGSPEIRNNLLVANSALGFPAPHGRGGAIFLNPPANALPLVYNNTILNNYATNGGGAIYVNTNGAAQIVNNLIAFNQSGIAAATSAQASSIEIRNNCLYGTTSNALFRVVLGSDNVTTDPRLVDWRAGSYRLRADSPCLDSGDPSIPQSEFDVLHESRVTYATIDIGADEFIGPLDADYTITLTQPVQGAASVAPATIPVAATVTGPDAPAYVEFSANDHVVATVAAAPYSSFATGLVLNEYDIVAKAITASGSVATSAPVHIQVVLPPGNVPPQVRFTAPTNSQVFVASNPTNIRASLVFSKPNGRILSWSLYRGSERVVQNVSVGPNQTNAAFTVPNVGFGEHTLIGTVFSSVGDSATNSVSFTIQRPPLVPPEITLSAPRPGDIVLLEMTLPSIGAIYQLEQTSTLTNWTVVAAGLSGPSPFTTNIPVSEIEFFRGTGVYPVP